MKKTKFIGIVNGVEYNNVADYNTAINEAMKTGVVNASTRTEVVDNEPEEVHNLSEVVKEPAKKFVGVVNGVKYDCVEDYNDAIQTAINSGVAINAYTETNIVNPSSECECECEEDNTDYFPYFNEDDDLYLNVLATENAEADANAMEECKDYLTVCKQPILDNLKSFEDTELVDYMNSIEDLLGEIKDDYDNSNLIQDQIKSRMADRDTKMTELGKEQEADAKKLSVLDRGYQAMKKFQEFYEEILRNVIVESEKRQSGCAIDCPVTTCEEKEPQKEQMIYTTDELKSAVKTLMERLFGK